MNSVRGLNPYFWEECQTSLDDLYDVWVGNDLNLPQLHTSDIDVLVRFTRTSVCR